MGERFEKRLFDVFNAQFEGRLKDVSRHQDAFDQVNNMFEEKIQVRPYSNYESFKNARSKRRRKK